MGDCRRKWFVLIVLVWAALLGVALLLDRGVAEWVRHTRLYDRTSWFVAVLKLPGNFLFTLAVCVLLVLFHRRSWRAAIPLFISGPMVGAGYLLLKWIVGRRRPIIVATPFDFHPFAHGFMGLVRAESGLSFPSGHASLAFATATCLTAALPRWWMIFFAIALCVGAERVLENAHYLSDVVAGAGLGVLCGWIALGFTERLFNRSSRGLDPTVLPESPESAVAQS
jgi:undecaprenyl-diphosphatase